MLVVPRKTFYARRFYKENFPRIPRTNMRLVYENRSWRAYAAPGCA